MIMKVSFLFCKFFFLGGGRKGESATSHLAEARWSFRFMGVLSCLGGNKQPTTGPWLSLQVVLQPRELGVQTTKQEKAYNAYYIIKWKVSFMIFKGYVAKVCVLQEIGLWFCFRKLLFKSSGCCAVHLGFWVCATTVLEFMVCMQQFRLSG